LLAVTAGLLWFPNHNDPLPPFQETAAGVTAAIAAALVFRLIALRERRVDAAQVSPASMLFGSTAIVMLVPAALLWRAEYAHNQQFDVRYNRISSVAPTNDHTPLELTLHEYGNGEQSRAFGQYWTTGRSLRFRLPRAYLWEIHLQRGGGQKRITIHAHPETFQPFKSPVDKRLQRPDLNIQLEANRGSGTFEWEALHLHDRKPENYVGDHCGIWFVADDWRPEIVEGIRNDWPKDLTALPKQSKLIGAVRDANASGANGVRCIGTSDCQVSFNYRGFEGTYRIDRNRLCDWPQQTAQVTKFLDHHLIGQTPRRAAGSTSPRR
jgi:hypothetical protein